MLSDFIVGGAIVIFSTLNCAAFETKMQWYKGLLTTWAILLLLFIMGQTLKIERQLDELKELSTITSTTCEQ